MASFLKSSAAAAVCISAVLLNGRLSVSAAQNTFTSEVTPCSDGKRSGAVNVMITGGSDRDDYYISIDGGKKFSRASSRKISYEGLCEGVISICIKNSAGGVSPVSVYYVPDSSKKYPVMISADSYAEKYGRDGHIKVHITNYDREKSYQVSADFGSTWTDVYAPGIDLAGLSAGTAGVCIREKDSGKRSPMLEVRVASPAHGRKKFINADYILQNPELPTGCEITSLTMLLNYIGFRVDKLTMADKYLPKGEYKKSDFYKVFVGDPRSIHAFGCFSEPIARAAEDYLAKYDTKKEWEVCNITGCPPDSLYAAVDEGNPVVVWASGDMDEISPGCSWVVEETGETVVWPANEHCLLLTGYDFDKKIVCFNDPMNGRTSYDMAKFEEMFSRLGRHAVIITRKDMR